MTRLPVRIRRIAWGGWRLAFARFVRGSPSLPGAQRRLETYVDVHRA